MTCDVNIWMKWWNDESEGNHIGKIQDKYLVRYSRYSVYLIQSTIIRIHKPIFNSAQKIQKPLMIWAFGKFQVNPHLLSFAGINDLDWARRGGFWLDPRKNVQVSAKWECHTRCARMWACLIIMREREGEKVKTNPWKCWQILTFSSWLWINAWSQRLHLVGDPVQLGPCLPKVSAPAKAPKQDSQDFTVFNLSSIRQLEKIEKKTKAACSLRGSRILQASVSLGTWIQMQA